MFGLRLSLWQTFPRQVVYLDRNGNSQAFRISLHWDGRLKLLAKPELKNGRFVLALDSEIPYRRHFQLARTKRYGRQLMLELAQGLFPFEPDQTHYCLGEWTDRHYVCALPSSELVALTSGYHQNPAAIVISQETPEAICDALTKWGQRGNVFDLLAKPRPLPPSVPLGILLGMTLLAIVSWGAHHLIAEHTERQEQVRAKIEGLDRQAQWLARRRQVLYHMDATHAAVDELVAAANSWPQKRLDDLLQSIPRGVEIRSVEFDGDVLRVMGWDSHALSWLEAFKDSVEIIEHQKLPERDYFVIAIKP